jgi:hypothetical protein
MSALEDWCKMTLTVVPQTRTSGRHDVRTVPENAAFMPVETSAYLTSATVAALAPVNQALPSVLKLASVSPSILMLSK